VGARINLGDDPQQLAQTIANIVKIHNNSSVIHKTAGDLSYRLFDRYQQDKFLQQMNQYYQRAVELEPNSPNLYGSAAYAFYKTNQPEKAKAFLDRQLSLPINNQYPFSWILLARIYFDRGDKAATISSLEKAYAQMTDQPVLKHFLHALRVSPDIKKLY